MPGAMAFGPGAPLDWSSMYSLPAFPALADSLPPSAFVDLLVSWARAALRVRERSDASGKGGAK